MANELIIKSNFIIMYFNRTQNDIYDKNFGFVRLKLGKNGLLAGSIIVVDNFVVSARAHHI